MGGALLFVGALWAGAAALAAIPAAQVFGSTPHLQTADLGRFLPAIGYVAILLFGAFGAIAMIDSTAIVIMRTGALPKWLAWLGFVAAVVLLFGVLFLPMIALPIWLIAASVVLFRLPSLGAEPVAVVPTPLRLDVVRDREGPRRASRCCRRGRTPRPRAGTCRRGATSVLQVWAR